MVRSGYKWNIGTGHNIPIWDNRCPSDGSIISKPLNLDWMMENMIVSDLLLNGEKCWNTQLVHDIFDDDTVTSVLKTPLINSVATDKIVWRYEKNGIYSVKSAYRYYIEDAFDTSHLSAPGHWSLIWKAKAPPKINKNLSGGYAGIVSQLEHVSIKKVFIALVNVHCVKLIMKTVCIYSSHVQIVYKFGSKQDGGEFYNSKSMIMLLW